MSGGAYKAGDRVELGMSQLEREGSLSEPGLMGSTFIPTEAPSLCNDPVDDDCESFVLSDYNRKYIVIFRSIKRKRCHFYRWLQYEWESMLFTFIIVGKQGFIFAF